jgi:hypothetical protein
VEHVRQDVRVHRGERGAGLDRHVDPAVLTELVAGVGQGLDGILDPGVPGDALGGFHDGAPLLQKRACARTVRTPGRPQAASYKFIFAPRL